MDAGSAAVTTSSHLVVCLFEPRGLQIEWKHAEYAQSVSGFGFVESMRRCNENRLCRQSEQRDRK